MNARPPATVLYRPVSRPQANDGWLMTGCALLHWLRIWLPTVLQPETSSERCAVTTASWNLASLVMRETGIAPWQTPSPKDMVRFWQFVRDRLTPAWIAENATRIIRGPVGQLRLQQMVDRYLDRHEREMERRD